MRGSTYLVYQIRASSEEMPFYIGKTSKYKGFTWKYAEDKDPYRVLSFTLRWYKGSTPTTVRKVVCHF